MADTKTSALGAIPAVDGADVLPIVDATDTTTKKVSVTQLAEAPAFTAQYAPLPIFDDTPAAPAEGRSQTYFVTSDVSWPSGLLWSTDPDGGVAPTITGTALVSLYTYDGTTRAVLGATFPALDAPPDETAPTAGTLGVVVGSTTADLTVSGAADETALHATPYAYSSDNGSTYTAYQAGATYQFTGLTAETSYTFRHRVRDAAGNVSVGTAVTDTTDAEAGFAPTDIAGLIAWWDASDTATITDAGAGAVSQWDDKSSAGRDATQGTAGLRPTTGADTKNGLNVLTFNEDRLSFTGITSNGAPLTVFVVGKKGSAVTNKNIVLSASAAANTYAAFAFASDSGTPVVTRTTVASDAAGGLNVPTNSYYLMYFTDTGGTTAALQCWNNGFAGAAKDCNVGGSPWNVIGGYPAGSGFDLIGTIAEIVIYDTVLSGTDLTTVTSYLNDKWAVY